MKRLIDVDPEIANAIRLETERQASKLELIASENFVSEAVLEAMGSPLTNKYAEGYPGKRYYGGCEFVDVAETLAIERAKQLFGADHANVQPHSGAQANMAAYFALLNYGDTILGLNLGARRPPDPRESGQLLRPILQGDPVQRGRQDGADRHGRGAPLGQGAPAQDDRHGRECVPAHAALRPIQGGGRRGRRLSHGGHRPPRRDHRRRIAPLARSPLRLW